MHVIILRFAENRAKAPELMAGHKDWIAKGFADGVFLSVGSLEPEGGGGILAHAEDRAALAARVARDPFVAEGVVRAEIVSFSASQTDPRLGFLKV